MVQVMHSHLYSLSKLSNFLLMLSLDYFLSPLFVDPLDMAIHWTQTMREMNFIHSSGILLGDKKY